MARVLELSQLNHAVAAPNVGERLRIRIRDARLPDGSVDLREAPCKVYVGALSAVMEGPDGRPDKAKLQVLKLEVQGGKATAEIDVGVPHPQEPWGIRVKFYHRPATALFRQEHVAECIDVVPRPMSKVACTPGGHIGLEVLRIVPGSALKALQEAVGRILGAAVLNSVVARDIEDLCIGARELGEDTLRWPGAVDALGQAAKSGKVAIVGKLLAHGVPATAAAARAAENLATPESVDLARTLLGRYVGLDIGEKGAPTTSQAEVPLYGSLEISLLNRAIDERLPLVAEKVLDEDPASLNDLPPTAVSAQRVHTASAWSVLAALLNRGDAVPYQLRNLLDFALRLGHSRLARACLSRCQGFEHMQAAIHTCLDNGRIEIVRGALEMQWRQRSNQWSENTGPSILDLECGPADEPTECSICFEPLWRQPGIFLNDEGFRVCQHFCCLECAEHVQDEANERLRIWGMRRDPRLPQPPGPVCPMCRAPFTKASRLTDPTVDPRTFFRLSCLPEENDDVDSLRLRQKMALGVLCALLPLNGVRFAEILSKDLWPAWCKNAISQECLAESDFLSPGGMLAWVSAHILERKVENVRGSPPSLHDSPEKWFRFFDYDGKGVLTKPEVLRGVAKAYDVSALANPETLPRHCRSEGVRRLRDVVDAVWDEDLWREGVPALHFLDPGGLAERLLSALPPPHMAPGHSMKHGSSLSVEDALAKAREVDMQVCAEDQSREKERAERQRQAVASLPVTRAARRGGRGAEPGRAGAELLLASLLEAERERQRGQAPPQIRIQCPFCGAVNQARASAQQRIICGRCHSTFSVPAVVSVARGT